MPNRFVKPITSNYQSQFVDNSLAYTELSASAGNRQKRIDKGVEDAGSVTALINAIAYDPNDEESGVVTQEGYKSQVEALMNSGIDAGSTEFSKKLIGLQNEFATDTNIRNLKFNAIEQAKFDTAFAKDPNMAMTKKQKEDFLTKGKRVNDDGSVNAVRFADMLPYQDVNKSIQDSFKGLAFDSVTEGLGDGATLEEIEQPDGSTKLVAKTKDGKIVTKENYDQIESEIKAQINRLLSPTTIDAHGKYIQRMIAEGETTEEEIKDLIYQHAGAQRLNHVSGTPSTFKMTDGQDAVLKVDENVSIVATFEGNHQFTPSYELKHTDGITEQNDDGSPKFVNSTGDEAYEQFDNNVTSNYTEFIKNPANIIFEDILAAKSDTPIQQNKERDAINDWFKENLEDFDVASQDITISEDGGKTFDLFNEKDLHDDNLVADDLHDKFFNFISKLYPDLKPGQVTDYINATNDKIRVHNSESNIRNNIYTKAEDILLNPNNNNFTDSRVAEFNETEQAIYAPKQFPKLAEDVANKTMNGLISGRSSSINIFSAGSTISNDNLTNTAESGENSLDNGTFTNSRGKEIKVSDAIETLQGVDFTNIDADALSKLNELGYQSAKEFISDFRKATWEKPNYAYDATGLTIGQVEAGVDGKYIETHKSTENVWDDATSNIIGIDREDLEKEVNDYRSILLDDHIKSKKGTTYSVFTSLGGQDVSAFTPTQDAKQSAIGRMELTIARIFQSDDKGANKLFRDVMQTENMTFENGQALNSDEGFYSDILGTDAGAAGERKGKTKELKYPNRAEGLKHVGLSYEPKSNTYKGVGVLVNFDGNAIYKDGEPVRVLYESPQTSINEMMSDMLGEKGNNANFVRAVDLQANSLQDPTKTAVEFTNDVLLPGVNASYSRDIGKGGENVYKVDYQIPELLQNKILENLQQQNPNITSIQEAEYALGFKMSGSIGNKGSIAKSELGQKMALLHNVLKSVQTTTQASEKGTILPDDFKFTSANVLETEGFNNYTNNEIFHTDTNSESYEGSFWVDQGYTASEAIEEQAPITLDEKHFDADNIPVIDEDVQDNLNLLTAMLGPIVLTSVARTKAGNKAVGGVDNSDHTVGRAIDIKVTDLNEVQTQALQNYLELANEKGDTPYTAKIGEDYDNDTGITKPYEHTLDDFGISFIKNEGDHIHIQFKNPGIKIINNNK